MEETYGLKDYSDGTSKFSTDPVCGVAVKEDEAEGKVGFEGQMYYFCSADCKRAFEEYPSRYAGLQR